MRLPPITSSCRRWTSKLSLVRYVYVYCSANRVVLRGKGCLRGVCCVAPAPSYCWCEGTVCLLHQLKGTQVHTFSNSVAFNAPDACFPNNWFSTHYDGTASDSTLVLYSMKAVTRRNERRHHIIAFLRRMYAKEISFVDYENDDLPRILEGTGSLVLDRVIVYPLILFTLVLALLTQLCHRSIEWRTLSSRSAPPSCWPAFGLKRWDSVLLRSLQLVLESKEQKARGFLLFLSHRCSWCTSVSHERCNVDLHKRCSCVYREHLCVLSVVLIYFPPWHR